MVTVRDLLRSGDDLPGGSARRDTEILLGYSLSRPRSWLYTWPDREVTEAEIEQFQELLSQRREGHPVAYLVGEREFWSLPLQVNQHTLIPRPETETLVSVALELPVSDRAKVLDLGTGSGAIALALASEKPLWQVQALDASGEALAVANSNAERLGLRQVRFLQSNWYAALTGQRFHLLVANPPYVEPDDIHLQEGDLRFEPRSALVSGEQGLADLAHLIGHAPDHLHADGWILLEHGYTQGEQVRQLLRGAGFTEVSTWTDLAGQDRVTGARLDAQ